MREFLRAGAFGSLRIGSSREQVYAALGGPDNWSIASDRQGLPAIWKYGVVEFHFDARTDTVVLIHADDFDHFHAGVAVDLDPWWMRSGATLEQARAELAAAHLRVDPVDWHHDDGTVRLLAGDRTELVFACGSPQSFLSFSHGAIWLQRFRSGSGLIDDMGATAVSVELRRTGEARYTLRLLGASAPITIAIWTTRKSMIRAEYWDDRPAWVALSTDPDDRLQSLTVDHCDFHFEHVDRDRYIMGFERHDQSWYMAIIAGGYIKTRVVPSRDTPGR